MASASLIRNSLRPDLYVCARCTFRASKVSSKTSKRWIGMKYLAKAADAEADWQRRASNIKDGKQKSMLTTLEERGLVQTVTGTRDEVDKMMTEKRVGAYVGIDPTASSLHVGHMLPLMSLFWMYVHGYHAVSLLGGATSKIGDPTDRLTSREKQHSSIRTQNMVSMHYQLKKLWVNVEAYGRRYGYEWEWAWKRELVNNNMWLNKLPLIEVLQILGPGMRMGAMLARDTVKNKMKNGDGMSFAEFSYPLLQAWDWWHMYQTKGIQMQIGGADQYGNITAGIDAVKYISSNHSDPDVREAVSERGSPFGITVPLLTTSSGQKFGKSAGNAIWLDIEQTSSYELYKFFLGTSDADVGRYLKLFTFMPIPQIDTLVEEHMQSPPQRKAQHALAREFVELIHGVQEAKNAEAQHRLLFSKSSSLPQDEFAALEAEITGKPLVPHHEDAAGITSLNNRPKAHMKLPRSVIEGKSIGRILYAAGLASSATEGHKLSQQGGAYIGGHPGGKKEPMNDASLTWSIIKTWVVEDTKKFLLNDNLLFLRRGKNNIRIIDVISDAEYEELGLSYPGIPDGANASHEEKAEDLEKIEQRDSIKAARKARKDAAKGLRTQHSSSGLEEDIDEYDGETGRYERPHISKRDVPRAHFEMDRSRSKEDPRAEARALEWSRKNEAALDADYKEAVSDGGKQKGWGRGR